MYLNKFLQANLTNIQNVKNVKNLEIVMDNQLKKKIKN